MCWEKHSPMFTIMHIQTKAPLQSYFVGGGCFPATTPLALTGLADRLEARGLMQRNASAQDRRVRLLTLTAAGVALLAALVPAMLQAQQRILSPLPEAERGEFMRMLAVLIAGHRTVEDTPGAG